MSHAPVESKIVNKRFASGVRLVGQAGLALALSCSTALATSVPTNVNPGQLEKRFDAPAPAPAPKVSVPDAPKPGLSREAQEQLRKKRFVLKSVKIEGNTAFTDEQLADAYEGKIGKEISLLDAHVIAERITDKYRSNQYILSQAVVPPQSVSGGVLTIKVIEGYIANVTLQGDVRDGDHQIAQSYAQGLTSKRPVRLADMERYLLLMDDLPGSTAKGLVRPSSTPGAADLVVTFEHKDYEASYTIDNRGSKFVGPIQHSVTLAANSLLNMYDRTLLRVITTSPTKELRFWDLQHEQQIGDEGTRLVLDASYSHSEPGDTLKSTMIRSDSYFFQAKAVHPFIRSRAENLLGRAILDYRNTNIDVFAVTSLSKDHLRVARAGGSYDFADAWLGVNLFDAEISQGLDVLDASKKGDPVSNTNADGTFTKINADVTRTQALHGNWSLFASATGQYAFDPLLPAEQFSLGGAGFGRAYDPAELTGDHGAAAKLEIRYGDAVDDPLLESFQVYGFYDIGRVWTRKSPANTDKSLASAGLGVRTNFSEHLSGNLEVAKPLTRPAGNQGSHGEEPRLFFSFTGRF